MALYQTRGRLLSLTIVIKAGTPRYDTKTGKLIDVTEGKKACFKDSFLKTDDEEVIAYLDSHEGAWYKLDSIKDARQPEEEPEYMRVNKRKVKALKRVYERLEKAEEEEKAKLEVVPEFVPEVEPEVEEYDGN